MAAPFTIDRVDHFVLTVVDIDETCDFYDDALGMERETFAGGRTALKFGQQKINLHPAAEPYNPHADNPVPGAADFCLITDTSVDDVKVHLESLDIDVFIGPTSKTGAMGPLTSIYFRDPSGNLVEISNYD